jgi:6-phosphofructokinase 1
MDGRRGKPAPADRLERDAHGNISLGRDLNLAFEHALAEGLPGKRARVDALGYMPRGYIGAINETDQQEAYDAGVFAVDTADHGGGSVALQLEEGKTVIRRVALSSVAGKTRHMPDNFLLPDANHLSQEGMAYLRRLIPAKYEIGRPFV